ncbi:glucosylceramidase [Leptolyngbya sp. Heron Island J]|uniref:GH116 family glycosyl hydrolase n=1 Tax=Leptolyngbya sp. Heron Island J TaxID=1385935 RepID=UPI0003B9F4AD|nr:GH116 family glycosyl hydrolase [Leptolyngbya sp. Heron Island J]ESA32075.1 glucosylceramidase [Leptolyngbya sp. Heron Island J]
MPAPTIPSVAWTWPIGAKWETPYIVRYASNLDDGPEHGMPLGGLGAGCIGRAPNGTFNLWHLDGGEHIFDHFPACQFAVYEETDTASQTYAMATAGDGLSSWQWYPARAEGSRHSQAAQGGTYKALYPRSWYAYQDVFQAELTCEQFSPIWPDNYQESSYPVAVFVWTAHNPTDQPMTLSILLSWQNMVGWFTNAEASSEIQQREDGSPFYDYGPRLRQSAGNFNQLVQAETATGIVMDGAWSGHPNEGDGQFCIAVPGTPGVTYHTCWNPNGDGTDLWESFAASGVLKNVADTTSAAADGQVGCAIALKFTLAPGETQTLPFVLSWDLPVTEFAPGKHAYRRYTDFYDRSGRNAWQLAQDALANYQTWRQKIIDWQQPILERTDLPDWFKLALFNELYDMASGGTLWSAASDRDPVGQFGVLECMDYRWYESLDVRLYGGFSTLMLWPELEKAIIRAFARAIPTEDPTKRIIGYYYTVGDTEHLAPRKLKGATPHDLGAPNEHPWQATNYTSYQDCNQWKDLPSDFVLQVYRAFLLTGGDDIEFLAECWPAVTQTLQYLKLFDLDGDGVPENGGAPDQTFDDWQLKGVSAYCGGLWLAALAAAIKMGDLLQQHQKISGSFAIVKSQYQRWIKQGKIVYQNKLWTGSFYRLDSESHSDVVMADQLCGQFCARLLDLPDIVDEEYIHIALDTIYDACFVKFNEYAANYAKPQNQKFEGAQTGLFSAAQLGMAIGAANGVKPDGSPENPDDTHQLEVWTGINFGLAAFLAQMGKRDKAMAITAAVVRQIYDHGLQFRTPEAITAMGTFRACHYLRPMAIWGLYAQL